MYTVAPCWDERNHTTRLFVERGIWDDDQRIQVVTAIDDALGQINDEYREQAGEWPARTSDEYFGLNPGTWEQWDRDRLGQTGGTAEQYKHPCLIGDLISLGNFRAETD